jgi:hypothetical protein
MGKLLTPTLRMAGSVPREYPQIVIRLICVNLMFVLIKFSLESATSEAAVEKVT